MNFKDIQKNKLIILSILVFLFVVFTIIVMFRSFNNTETNLPKPDFSIKSVNENEFIKTIEQNKNITLLDLRTKSEYESGHIKNATNLDFYLQSFETELNKLDKSKEYAIYCNSGNRSKKSIDIMKRLGFSNIVELDNGYQSLLNTGNFQNLLTK